MTVTFACVFVKGYVGYDVTYVKNLAKMVRRHYEGRYRFACLTDQPDKVGRFVDEVIEIPVAPFRFPWWAKVELFKPGRFEGRVCYLDLDVLIIHSLNVIAEYPARFALVPHAGSFEGR